MQNSLSDSITLVTTLLFYWMILNLAAPAFTHKAGETEPPNADSKLKTFIRDMLEKRGEHFSVSDFLYGAREARRVILHDFARGDKDGLRPLVTKEVFDAFCKAIDERTLRQETLDISLDERSSAYIADARSLVDCSEITVVSPDQRLRRYIQPTALNKAGRRINDWTAGPSEGSKTIAIKTGVLC